MAVFAPTGGISGAFQNLVTLVAELLGLATSRTTALVTSPTSVTSGSDTTILTASKTVVDNELIRIDYTIRYSVGDTSTYFTVTPYANGVAIAPSTTFKADAGSSSGITHSLSGYYYSQDLSGSINFDVKVARTAGSATCYFDARRIDITTTKRRT